MYVAVLGNQVFDCPAGTFFVEIDAHHRATQQDPVSARSVHRTNCFDS